MKLFVFIKMRPSKNTLKVVRGTESDLAYTKLLGGDPQYIWRSGSLWHPLSSSMLKNKRMYLLVISKLMLAFSLWLRNLVYPKSISTNTSSNNNSRSLTGVIISPSVLKFGMFVHSATLILQFFHLISRTSSSESWNNSYFFLSCLSQQSIVLSQMQIDYLYYHEFSLTVLQNYIITTFVNLWLTPWM